MRMTRRLVFLLVHYVFSLIRFLRPYFRDLGVVIVRGANRRLNYNGTRYKGFSGFLVMAMFFYFFSLGRGYGLLEVCS